MSIEDHSQKLNELKLSIESLDAEYEEFDGEVNELLVEFEELRRKLQLAKDKKNDVYWRRQKNLDEVNRTEREIARLRQEETERLSKEPDLTNPEMEKILLGVSEWPEWKKLRDYQKADLIFTWDRFLRPKVTGQWGVFNANATSLGKTAETALTIRGLRILYPEAKALWLTKSALVKSSARQCSEWGLKIVPLTGSAESRISTVQFIGETMMEVGIPESYITNYESLNTPLMKELEKKQWLVIAVDEMHRLRGGANASGPTKMWLGLKKMLHSTDSLRVTDLPTPGPAIAGEGRPFPIFMSGSLINNGSEEVWAYVHLFNPIAFPSRQRFKQTFLSMWGGVLTDVLMKVLSANFFRKTKAEVGLFMHDKIYQDHYIEMERNSDLWTFQKEITDNFLLMLDSMGDDKVSIAGILAEFHYARMANVAETFHVAVPIIREGMIVKDENGKVMKEKVLRTLKPPLSKLQYAAEHIFEMVMGEGENVLVFSAQFNTPIAWLMEKLKAQGIKCDAITGDKRLAPREADAVEQDFQQNEIQVLFLNMKSGAEGLNLHKDKRWPGGSSNVVLLDRWWNPAINEQAVDRAWRLDCLEPVTIHRYSVEETVDFIIDGICEDKTLVAEGITEHTALRATEWRAKLSDWLKKPT